MRFELTEEDYLEMHDSFERTMEASERYEGLNPEEIADLEEDKQNRKAYEEMMQASWSY